MRKRLLILPIIASVLLGFLFSSKHPVGAQSSCPANTSNMGQVTGSFNIPVAGTYRIWSRIMTGVASTDNSYILEIDGTTCNVTVGNAAIPANTWTWVDYRDGTSSNKIELALTAGTHTFTLYGREPGVKVDRVIFSGNLNCIPSGTGGNCATAATSGNTFIAGDVNGNGVVDIFDLSVLLGNWNLTGRTWGQGDMNYDSSTNIFDLSILLANWGRTGSTSSGCASSTPFVPDGPDPWGGCWPGTANTGVPPGTTLSAYTGPCTITADNTVIDARTVNCILTIEAANVSITRSVINGGVNVPTAAPSDASFSISDSNVNIGETLNTGLMRRNFTANRVEITGGLRGVYCQTNCTVENTWVHDQSGDPGGSSHFSGMRMEQLTTYRHNTITCEADRGPGTGCSAGLTGYGDFAPVQDNLIERNLFYRGGNGGSTMCAYGGSSGDDGSKPYGHLAQEIRFISNRFVRDPETGHCGNLGTILDFDPARPGNVWTDNLFHDGAVVNATGP